MLKETDELKFLGQLFSRYSLSPKLLERETGAILKNFHPSGKPIWPHPLTLRAIRCTIVQLHGPTPCGRSHLDS